MSKKLRWFFLLLSIILLLFYFLQFGRRKIEIQNTRIIRYQNGYKEYINLVTNQLFIADKNKFAYDVICRYIDNSFNDIKFSFDIGYPSEVIFTVYMNKWDKNSAFEICCMFDLNDIKEKPDYFEFKIRK